MAITFPGEDVSFSYEGFSFGGYSGDIIVNDLTIQEPKYRGTDTDNPTDHGAFSGRALLGAGSWEFNLTTNGTDRDSAYDLHRALYVKWRSHLKEINPRTKLYYRIGSRVGYVIGHPADISIPKPDVPTGVGVAKFSMRFVQTDPIFYRSDADGKPAGSITLLLNEIRYGGTTFPVVFPVVFGQNNEDQTRQGQIVNGSDNIAPFTVKISANAGPLRAPAIWANGWKISYPNLTIPAGRYIMVDTLAMTSKWDDGTPAMPGADSRLSARLQPGAQEVYVNGSDDTNTATFEFSWGEGSYSI